MDYIGKGKAVRISRGPAAVTPNFLR